MHLNTISRKKSCWLLPLILAALLLMLPSFILGIPQGPDLLHHYRLALGLSKALNEGVFYPSWIPASNHGFGDASFRVYPPGLYYLLSLTKSVIGNWYSTWLVAFLLITLVGGFGAFFWSLSLVPRKYAVWAGVIYIFAPFHVNEFYQSALLAEYAGGAAMAFVFCFAERVCRRGNISDLCGLAVSYALLVLTHIPLTMIGTMSLVIYVALIIGRATLKQTLIKLGGALLLGLAASSCFWVTLATELSWVKGDTIQPGLRYNYQREFLFSTFSPENLNVFFGNILALVTLGIIGPALIGLFRQRSLPNRSYRALIFLIVFSFVMTTPLSLPVWQIVPKLKSIEFPWRWLALTSLFGSVGFAAGLPFWIKLARTHHRPVSLLAFDGVSIAVDFSFLQPVRGALYTDRTRFEALSQSLPQTPSLEEWVPIWGRYPMPAMDGKVEIAGRTASINTWQTGYKSFKVDSGESAQARVHTYYYPHWVATSDGHPLPISPADDGALLISVPSGEVQVNLIFREPLLLRCAAFLAALAWLLLGIGLLLNSFQRQSTSASRVACT